MCSYAVSSQFYCIWTAHARASDSLIFDIYYTPVHSSRVIRPLELNWNSDYAGKSSRETSPPLPSAAAAGFMEHSINERWTDECEM